MPGMWASPGHRIMNWPGGERQKVAGAFEPGDVAVGLVAPSPSSSARWRHAHPLDARHHVLQVEVMTVSLPPSLRLGFRGVVAHQHEQLLAVQLVLARRQRLEVGGRKELEPARDRAAQGA